MKGINSDDRQDKEFRINAFEFGGFKTERIDNTLDGAGYKFAFNFLAA
jgi:hypothetical protein